MGANLAPFTGPLPTPRLQMRWQPSTRKREYNWECHYELVIPLKQYDIRGERYDENEERIRPDLTEAAIPMKEPTLRGGNHAPCTAMDGTRYCDAPYRDGAHARWDSEALGGLPVFVIAPDATVWQDERKDTAS